MGEISAIKLIDAIKIRPALYNKEDSMYYSHRKFKHKLWKEVCQEVYGNWDLLKPHRKLEYARELQKRWKSLRTCFTRELSLQRKEKLQEPPPGPRRKRKMYEYFNSLKFLLPPASREEYDVGSDDPDPEDINVSEIHRKVASPGMKIDDMTYAYGDSPSLLQNIDPRNIADVKVEREYTPEQLVYDSSEPLGEKIETYKDMSGEEDEDRQFLLSLVSSFKRLDERKKFEARIGILKLLQEITFREDTELLGSGL